MRLFLNKISDSNIYIYIHDSLKFIYSYYPYERENIILTVQIPRYFSRQIKSLYEDAAAAAAFYAPE